MKIRSLCSRGQAYHTLFLALFLLLAAACNRKEETPIIPPLSSPLSQAYIGFGVVNVSYTRVMDNLDETALETSPGYLRRGAVVRILERRTIKNGNTTESWLRVEENSKGWLRESLVDIYDNEAQARTASGVMLK
jgi:hypothetical protein